MMGAEFVLWVLIIGALLTVAGLQFMSDDEGDE